jgi:Fe-S-cluster containining protein
LILGKDRVISWGKEESGLYLMAPERLKPHRLPYDQLAGYLCAELTTARPSLHALSGVCRCVFHEKAYPFMNPEGGCDGILLETGMERFRCRQCANCCRHLEYHGELTDADYRLWRLRGRKDILKHVRIIRKNGEIVAYRIWCDPATGNLMEGCPWLERLPEEKCYRCLIHDVRPGICRQYPGSRKHGRMTGCPGFED